MVILTGVGWALLAKARLRYAEPPAVRTPQHKHEQVALVGALHPPRAQLNARTAVLDECSTRLPAPRLLHAYEHQRVRVRVTLRVASSYCYEHAMASAAAARCSSVHVPASLHPSSPARQPADPVQL